MKRSAHANQLARNRSAKVMLKDVVFTLDGIPRLTRGSDTDGMCEMDTCHHTHTHTTPVESNRASSSQSPQLSPHPSPQPSQPSQPSQPHPSPHRSQRSHQRCTSESEDSGYESCSDTHVVAGDEHSYAENKPSESIAERLSRLDIFLGHLHNRSQRAFNELVKTNLSAPLR